MKDPINRRKINHALSKVQTGTSFIDLKTGLQRPLKKIPKIGFQDLLSLNAGLKYLQNAPREHSAILSTFIKLPFVVKTFVLSFFEWSFYRFYCKYLFEAIELMLYVSVNHISVMLGHFSK